MAPASTLRKLFEERFSHLAADLEAELRAWVENETACRAAEARRELAERLNQAVRRLRQAPDFAELAAALVDSSAPFCNGAAVFRVTGSIVQGERARGLDGDERAGRFSTLRFPAAAGAAFAAAMESGDPVVALTSAAEVSPGVFAAMGHRPEDRVSIFPLSVHGKTAGLLYCWGDAQPAPLELLAQAAGAVLEASAAAPVAAPAELVAIAPAAAPPELSPDEQRVQLRAQRYARVAVAEFRLYHAAALAEGRARRDLYGALRQPIDAAREAYRRDFLTTHPGMPDYFHQELLHALANDDAGLLGEKYPGPLV